MTATITRITRGLVVGKGWTPGSSLEDRVCLILSGLGFKAESLAQQHPVGKYRLDFAAPDVLVAIEADGWYHRSPDVARKDADRDEWLRSQGWLVLRVADENGEDDLKEQLAAATRIVKSKRQELGNSGPWVRPIAPVAVKPEPAPTPPDLDGDELRFVQEINPNGLVSAKDVERRLRNFRGARDARSRLAEMRAARAAGGTTTITSSGLAPRVRRPVAGRVTAPGTAAGVSPPATAPAATDQHGAT